MNRKFVDTDADFIPELKIECPVPTCKAQPGDWCTSEGRGPGIHAKRIDAYAWRHFLP